MTTLIWRLSEDTDGFLVIESRGILIIFLIDKKIINVVKFFNKADKMILNSSQQYQEGIPC